MEHDQRSVLKDINGQLKMNPLHARDSIMNKRASTFTRQNDQTIYEDSDSSSSEDYKSAEEDEEFNKELDSMISGMKSVTIMTPRGKKLKAQLQRSFLLSKIIDPNLSQELIKEIENSNGELTDKENRCMEISNEHFESLLNQSEYESPVNTTIKLADTPVKVNQLFSKNYMQELVDEQIVVNQTSVTETKNQSEKCSSTSSVSENQYDNCTAIKNDPKDLDDHNEKKEDISLPPEEIISNKIESCGSINKSDNSEHLGTSQNKEMINSDLKVGEFIPSTLEKDHNIEITESVPKTMCENICQETKIVPKLDEDITIDNNLPETDPVLNTFENAHDFKIVSPKPETEFVLNTTIENIAQDSKIVLPNPCGEMLIDNNLPKTEPNLNTTFENIVQDTKIVSPKPGCGILIDNNLPQSEPILNTTFENIMQDSKIVSPKPGVNIKDNNLPETKPVLNTTLENIVQDSKIISPKPDVTMLVDNNLPKSEPVLNTTFSPKPGVNIIIDNNSPGTKSVLNTTFENVVHDHEILPVLSNLDEDLKHIQNLPEVEYVSNTPCENFSIGSEIVSTSLKPDIELKIVENLSEIPDVLKSTNCSSIKYPEDRFKHVSNRNEINDGDFKLPSIPSQNMQTNSDASDKFASIKTGIAEDFLPQPNTSSGDQENLQIVSAVNECSPQNLQEKSESSQIIKEMSDLNQTTIVCDNITKSDMIMINRLADFTIQKANQSDEISEQPVSNNITITHMELENQPNILSNLDQTVTLSDGIHTDKSPGHKLKINNSIAISGRLSDIFKTDLANKNFANSTFAENQLNETLTIEKYSANNTITEIQPEKNECDLNKKTNVIPNLNQFVTENIKPKRSLDLNTTVIHSKKLKVENDITRTLNETYDFRDKSESKNINESLDKSQEFELAKMINTPAILDHTVIISDVVSHNDIGSSIANKIENISRAPESFDLLNNTNNFQTSHKIPIDIRASELATKSNLQSRIIGNLDQVEKLDACRDLNRVKDNNELNGTFNFNRSQNMDATVNYNLSKNSLKLFDEIDSKSFSNEGSNVDLLCQTLGGINLNSTHVIDVKINLPVEQSEDLTQDKLPVFVKSERGTEDKNVFENSFMKFDESSCNSLNSNIPELVVTNENVPKDNSNNIIGSPISANTLLLGSPISQNNQTSEKQNIDRPVSPKSTTSIFKWIGQFLSPAKFSSDGQIDNLKQHTDELNNITDNIKQDSSIDESKSKDISKIENDFVNLRDETPLPDFMSVSTTSEPFNESRVNNEEHIDYVNELIQLRQLVNQSEEKLKETRKEIETIRNVNDKLQQSIEEHEKVLDKKVEDEKVIGITINNFEIRVKELTVENELAIQENQRKLQEFKDDRDFATNHLSSVENAFSNLHKKYEQCKTAIEQMKKNEEILKSTNNTLRDIKMEQIIAVEILEDHVKNQLKTAEADTESHKKQHKLEMVKWTALIQKAELQKTSLEEALTKKQAENKELIDLCDGLIQKVT